MQALQQNLFAAGEAVGLGPLDEGHERAHLSAGAWLDLRPGWVGGADALFGGLAAEVDWQSESRPMYDRVVTVPRLQRFYEEGEALPHPVLEEALAELTARYDSEAGGPLCTVGLALYRDGHDSVAWHGDRIGRSATHDTVVAIVSLGSPRRLCLRPRGGRTAVRLELGPGDLLVMGGSCQRTWEHSVPKTARPVGPRMSVQFRPRGVR